MNEDNGYDPALEPLRPEAEGDCVVTVCVKRDGNLHYEQRRFTRYEMNSAGCFDSVKCELSKMLVRLDRRTTAHTG